MTEMTKYERLNSLNYYFSQYSHYQQNTNKNKLN